MDDTPEVDVHEPLEVVVAHGVDGGAEGDTGIVEDQVDLAVVFDDLIGPGAHRDPIRNVDALRRDLHTEAFAPGDRFGESDAVYVG